MKTKMMANRRNGRWAMFLAVVLVFVGVLFYQVLVSRAQTVRKSISSGEVVDFSPLSQKIEYKYLTDSDYLFAASGYGAVLKDATSTGAKISLKVGGSYKEFNKGIWAHATSNVYYDLRSYKEEGFAYLLVYVGLNKTANTTGNVKFSVYTSAAEEFSAANSGDWVVLPEMDGVVMTSSMEAKFLRIDIRNINYIRFYADSNGSNSNDHAVYGDLKLVKADYDANEYLVPAVSELEEKIVGEFAGEDLGNNSDYELNVLRRTLVERLTRQTILDFLQGSEENCETFSWFYNDLNALRLYINGGKISKLGTYKRSLEVLSELYHTYRDDLKDGTPLKTTSGTRGDLYLRMMITLSLTHAEHIRLWVKDRVVNADGQTVTGEDPESANISRPVDRYKVYKRMYLAEKLNTQVFEQLEVEEMRYVMAALTGDDETEWLHDYLAYNNRSPYSWPAMPYGSAGYWHLEDYADENQASLTEKYRLDGRALGVGDYKITNGKYQPHLWMILKWGGVCWQISNTGQNMMASFGIPSTTLGQRPDHVAYANYGLQGNGDGYWALTNNVYGWTTTDFVGYDGLYSYRYSNAPMRHMNDWGFFYDKRAYAYKYNGTYLLLAQAAINDYDNYVKAHELTLLAEAYAGDLAKQEEFYEQALAVQNINLDAWLGLIQVYKDKYNGANGAEQDGEMSEADQAYMELARRITEAYRIYPVPMYDMLRWFSSEIESPVAQAAVLMMQTRTLQAATKLTANDTVQYSAQVAMARHLLGLIDTEVATFSFDGEDAGKIKLSERFWGAAWDYSLDGGQTWSSGERRDQWINENEYKLSDAEIGQITATEDIKIHLSGVDWSDANIYTIDIVEQVLPATLYANDWENRVIGVNEKMEWRLNENDPWTSYRDSSPQRIGDVAVEVRVGRSGKGLPSKSKVFNFTADTDTETRKYLPIAHISVAGVSSEATSNSGSAIYAIDGNINTRWHSNYAGADRDKWITFKFDHNVYLTGMDYMPAGGGNGKILEGRIEISQDGENWTELGTVNWANNESLKSADFTVTDWARYVRITGVQTSPLNSSLSFIAARLFNFYEDSTRSEHPSAAIGYSTTELTNGDVIARFIKPTDDTVITNNNGSDTYVFKENGSFAFEFTANGTSGRAVAMVDWIDKEAPTGRIEFYCAGTNEAETCERRDGKTNHMIDARLVITNEKEEVKVLNNGLFDEENDLERSGQVDQLKDPFVFTFLRNGVFTFLVQDKAGNVGQIEAVVDWIDTAAPKTTVEYSTRNETEGPVVARVVKVLPDANEEGGLGENIGESEYFQPIEKELYDEHGLQYGEDFIVVNNGGKEEYVFTENGEFTFHYRDEAGNEAAIVAKVDWIKEKVQQPQPGVPEMPVAPVAPVVPVVPNLPMGDGNGAIVGGEVIEGGTTSTTMVAKGQMVKLPLSSNLKDKFGEQSEYFKVVFVGADGSTLEGKPEEVMVEISSTKVLKGVYLVGSNGETRKVEYEKVSDSQIVLRNPEEGNYLFEYGEVKNSGTQSGQITDDGDNADQEEAKPETKLSPWWVVGGAGVVVLLLLGGAMVANRRR